MHFFFFVFVYIHFIFKCVKLHRLHLDRLINARGEHSILMLLYHFTCRNYTCTIFLIRGIFHVEGKTSGCMNQNFSE